MPEGPPIKGLQKLMYYRATLPNGRTAELKKGSLSVWTRGGEELVFGSADVIMMKAMFDEEAKDTKAGPPSTP